MHNFLVINLNVYFYDNIQLL